MMEATNDSSNEVVSEEVNQENETSIDSIKTGKSKTVCFLSNI